MRLLLLMVFLAATSPALGRFVGVTEERIPVARLTENLEKIAKDDPTSVEALLNLGRAHGMAYAQKSDPLTVPKAYHGIQPPAVPFGTVTTAADPTLNADAPHLRPGLEGAAWLPGHVSCARCIGEQPLNCLKDGLWPT